MRPSLAPRASVPFVPSLEAIAPRYDLILCDVWGVLHNGVVAHDRAGDALSRFRSKGGSVVLVSNAPRPGSAVIEQLDGFRVPGQAYDAVLTSGDLTRAAVVERQDKVVHHIGPDRDLAVFAGLNLRFGSIEAAGYVVCTGLLDDERETAEDYRETLVRMRARDLLMICANPDLVVERGDRLLPCAGALAEVYEDLGGTVLYTGKPHRPIYDAALAIGARLAGGPAVPPSRVLAIGDAIRTDIAGAVGAGLASLFVTGGIHAAEIAATDAHGVQNWFDGQAIRPDWTTDALAW